MTLHPSHGIRKSETSKSRRKEEHLEDQASHKQISVSGSKISKGKDA
jgi:hypothetical protein